MATEKQLQEAIQTTIQALDFFDDLDVVINDWEILDQPSQQAPYVVIQNSDEFTARQDTATQTTRYTIKGWLVVELASRSWKDAYDELRDVRQAIGDAFVGSARSAGGLAGVMITAVHSLSDIGFIYAQGVDPEIQPDAIPQFLTQMLGFDVEQF